MTFIKKHKLVISLLYVHVYPILLFLTLEYMNYSESNNAFNRAIHSLPSVFLSYLIIYMVMLMFYAITKNVFASGVIVTGFLYLFYVVNYYRKLITSWVFVPTDLGFASNLGAITDFANLKIDIKIIKPAMVIFIFLVLLFIASLMIGKSIKILFRKRMCGLGICLVIFCGLFFTSFSKRWIMPLFNIDVRMKYTNNQVYDRNGVLMGFYISYAYNKMQVPNNYSEGAVNTLVSQVEKNVTNTKTNPVQKPNVICILSEAFSDPTIWDNISFSEDPIPNYRRLQSESIYGKLVTPAFSGETANVEYELLTGLAHAYTGHGRVPYNEVETYFSSEKMMALPNIYKENGYQTVALHTSKGDFYNRDKIYPRLGFDKFISSESMPDADKKGLYISDRYFTDKLIEAFENKEEEKPIFLFGISMENHYEYPPGKFKKEEADTIFSDSSLLSAEQKGSVDSYAHGISDADKQLQRLVDYLKGIDEPTILVFFGDHLPSVGNSAIDIYKTVGYVDSADNISWDEQDFYKMYTTTYLVWNNYKNENKNLGDISTYFLGNELLNMSGVNKTLYFHFLDDAYKAFHAMKSNLYVNEDGQVYPASLAEDETIMNMFYTFEYDQIFGNKYGLEKLDEIIEN